MVRGTTRGSLGGRRFPSQPGGRGTRGRFNFGGAGRGRARGRGRGGAGKKFRSEDQLDKDLENYWGDKVGSLHLDRDMEAYWEKKPEEPEQKE